MKEAINTNETAAAEPVSPVTDTGSSNAAPATLTDDNDRLTQSMSAAYDRATGDKGGQQSGTSDLPDSSDVPFPDHQPPALAPPPSINARLGLDLWNQMPREAQALLMEREAESQQKITSQGQEIAELKRLGGTGAELAGVLEQFEVNLPPHVAQMPRVQQIAALYKASEMLDRDPVNSIRQLAAQYGLDLSQLAYDPNAEAQRVQAMQHHQMQYQQLQHQHQLREQRRLQHIEKQILDYAKDKPHFADIESEIVTQINAIRDSNPSLYEADPLAVLKMAEERALSITKVATKQSMAEAKKRADEAKRFASINVKSNAGRSPTAASKDMWSSDGWDAAYDKAQRR